MRYEVVRLKNKTYAVIAVGVPVAVVIIFSRRSLDNKVARRILVEAAYDVEQGSFTAARRAENRNKFVAAEGKTYPFKRGYRRIAYAVVLCNVAKLKHCLSSLNKKNLVCFNSGKYILPHKCLRRMPALAGIINRIYPSRALRARKF